MINDDESITSEATEPADTSAGSLPEGGEGQEQSTPVTTAEAQSESLDTGDNSETTESLSDNSVTEQQPNSSTPEVQDWETEYQKLSQTRDRDLGNLRSTQQQLQQLQQQYEGVDPQQYQQLLQAERDRAEAQSLKTWNPRHPDYQNTQGSLNRFKEYLRHQSGDEAANRELAQRIGLTSEDVKIGQEFRAHQEQVAQELAADPEGFITGRVESAVQQAIESAFAQRDQMAQQSTAVNTYFDEVEQMGFLTDTVKEQAAAGLERYEHAGTQAVIEMSTENAILKEQIAKLQAQMGPMAQKSMAAAERERIQKGEAQVTTDGRSSGKSVEQIAAERGITASDPRYLDLLMETGGT